MRTQPNISLSEFTSLKVGGPAKQLAIINSASELVEVLESSVQPQHILGYGCNVLISDSGLDGLTAVINGGNISVEDDLVIADAGVWWDDVVKKSIDNQLWGLELMSEIPSSVGAAIFGNIAAYGAQISDTLEWLEVFNLTTGRLKRHAASDFKFGYRESSLQKHPELIIVRAGFRLSKTPLQDLKYDSAVAIGDELGLDHRNLDDCRKIIVETRQRAGSIYDRNNPNSERSAGSFFKNPLVSKSQARQLAKFDETGKTLERIENQSRVHGGNSHRASAAHILLAAGFHRGQSWGKVQLHDHHVLKIVTHEGATASEVYEVVQEILSTVKQKLSIDLEPEVKLLGQF